MDNISCNCTICVQHISQLPNHEKYTFLPWHWLFSIRVFFLIGLPLKPSVPPLLPPLFPTSLSSLRSLFGLHWNFDSRPLPCYRELNMPCPDLLSAATFIPLASNTALKPSEKPLFSEKHHPDLLFWDPSGGCFSPLFWVSVVNIFISLSGALALFERHSKLLLTTKSSSSICINLFLRDTLFSLVWTDVKKGRK